MSAGRRKRECAPWERDVEETLFRDRWTGGYSAFTDLWTPLIALANSPRYPPPPPELGEIWKDHARALARLRQIPKVEIDKRRADSITILNILLSHGCELDAADAMGATALFDAAREDKVLMVEALLDFGANPNTKTGTYFHNPSDMTPLHAAAGRSRQVIQLLLDHGADPLAKDDAGRTPADWIAEDPDSDIDLLKTPEGWRVVPRAKKQPEDSGGAKTGDP